MGPVDRLADERLLRTGEAVATIPVWPGFYFFYAVVRQELGYEFTGYAVFGVVALWMFGGVLPMGAVGVTSLVRSRYGEPHRSANRLDIGLLGLYLSGWVLLVGIEFMTSSLPRTGPLAPLVWIAIGASTLSVGALTVVVLGRFLTMVVRQGQALIAR